MGYITKVNMGGQDYDIRDKALAQEVANIKPIANYGTINNAADEEDITSEGNLLKLKDRSTLNGMGYVILRKNKTFAEQVTQPNTIYEIRYDYNLGGASITIPKGCILKFVGGSIYNGLVVFDDTKIEGNAIMSVTPHGTIIGIVNVSWFGLVKAADNSNFDNAPIINKVASVFKEIEIPVGNYNLFTPLNLKGVKLVKFDCNLYSYINDNNVAVITFEGLNSAVVQMNGGIINAVHIDLLNNTTNRRCVEVKNSNNSTFFINSIYTFNEGIRISNDDARGCSYNQVNFNFIFNCNYGVRFVVDAEGSWVNENVIRGKRMSLDPSFPADGVSWGIDVRDGADGLYIEGVSLEVKNGIYLNNCVDCTLLANRHEGNYYALKLHGNCERIRWIPSYFTGQIDLSASGCTGLSPTFFSPINGIALKQGNNTIDTTHYKFIYVSSLTATEYILRYKKTINGAVSGEEAAKYPTIRGMVYQAGEVGYFASASASMASGGIIQIPYEVVEIEVQVVKDVSATCLLYNPSL